MINKYFLSFNFEKRKFGLFFKNPIHYYREKQKFTTEHSIKTKTSQPAVISTRDLIGKIHSVADSIISQPFYKKKENWTGEGDTSPKFVYVHLPLQIKLQCTLTQHHIHFDR